MIYRNEYPRPQFARNEWICLNGQWDFEIDQADSGLERDLLKKKLKEKITVPFCPESKLSGIEQKDHLLSVWYKRELSIPHDWSGKRILLHFQAVDYDATVWINEIEVGRHRGGFSPFSIDITEFIQPGESKQLVVRARDRDDMPQPRGKQTRAYEGEGALYGRTTGIWQTVWMEPVPQIHLKRPRITPDLLSQSFLIEQGITNSRPGTILQITLSDSEGEIVTESVNADMNFTPMISIKIPDERLVLWKPGDPNLYYLTIKLLDATGEIIDSATSYAGMRNITISGKSIRINGDVVFQRLVLDQGYYPDGLMTAPSDEALLNDIKLSMAAGFNGARLHQKVFEERFLYHADCLGYIVWGEFGDWGARSLSALPHHQTFSPSYITEWLEVLERDYSHPCVVGWCPLNETWQPITDFISELDDITRGMYLATKAMDQTRPVLDTSGYSHRMIDTDIYDSHDYEQDPIKFSENQKGLSENKPYKNTWPFKTVDGYLKKDAWGRKIMNEWSVDYRGQPYFVSEFGGIWWNPDQEHAQSWGYGERPKTLEEFYDRFEKLCKILLENPEMFGYCYTQLTDIDQEENGIYKYDRSTKFDINRIRKIQTVTAAIERNSK
tara:strand:+ start:1435 stop:3270 length:1836 start_codon:yes stop_codon:yes gene_type:complete